MSDQRIDLDRLEQLAQQATPGPWRVSESPAGSGQVWAGHFCIMDDAFSYAREGDAPFIAACSPETVQALTRAVRAALAVDLAWDQVPLPIPSGELLRAALAPFRTGHGE